MTFAIPLMLDNTNIDLIPVSGNPVLVEPEEIHWKIKTASQIERISMLSQLYTIKQPGEVFKFLYNHPSLVEIIFEAADALHNVFGQDATLELELVTDPESDEAELFALVEVDMDPEIALQKLEEFDQNWLLDREEITNGLFNMDVIFR